MNINSLSKKFFVRQLGQEDIEIIYNLSCKNHIFYQYHPPFVTKESILDDMMALPPKKTLDDKYYIGFFDNNSLVAIMDLIIDYPIEKLAFIGLFMIDIKYRNKGVGSSIISEVTAYLRALNFEKVRIGVDKGNQQSYAFWVKNKFITISEEKYIIMELIL